MKAPRYVRIDIVNMSGDEQRLWTHDDLECVMVSCCAGAELQLRRRGGDVVLRELYPTKSDLYERARQLRLEHGAAPAPQP